MGCWVAPSIAADYWGMSLADVLAMMSGGLLQTQQSGGFSFIRLPMFSRPGQAIPPVQRPATFSLISDDATSRPKSADEELASEEISGEEADSELGPLPDEDPDDNRIAGWREGRRDSARRRTPPSSRTNSNL